MGDKSENFPPLLLWFSSPTSLLYHEEENTLVGRMAAKHPRYSMLNGPLSPSSLHRGGNTKTTKTPHESPLHVTKN